MNHDTQRNSRKAITAALLAAAATAVQAQVISWNYDANGTVPGGAAQAGVVLAANWNNSWPSNPTTDLVDNTGAATTMDLSSYGPTAYSWSIQGSHPGQDGNGSYNKELLNGYLNAGMAGWNPPVTNSSFSLSQIPYAQYDLYVYFSSDVAGRTGYLTDGTSVFYFSSVGPASVGGVDAAFTQTTETSSANHPLANYAVFSGLSGASQNITLQMEVSDLWGGIAGFQVVSVPEPGALGLGVLGLVALGAARRIRRS